MRRLALPLLLGLGRPTARAEPALEARLPRRSEPLQLEARAAEEAWTFSPVDAHRVGAVVYAGGSVYAAAGGSVYALDAEVRPNPRRMSMCLARSINGCRGANSSAWRRAASWAGTTGAPPPSSSRPRSSGPAARCSSPRRGS